MRFLFGFMASLYAMQYYARPREDGTRRPSYIALRDELYKPVLEEITKSQDRHLASALGSGIKAYF